MDWSEAGWICLRGTSGVAVLNPNKPQQWRKLDSVPESAPGRVRGTSSGVFVQTGETLECFDADLAEWKKSWSGQLASTVVAILPHPGPDSAASTSMPGCHVLLMNGEVHIAESGSQSSQLVYTPSPSHPLPVRVADATLTGTGVLWVTAGQGQQGATIYHFPTLAVCEPSHVPIATDCYVVSVAWLSDCQLALIVKSSADSNEASLKLFKRPSAESPQWSPTDTPDHPLSADARILSARAHNNRAVVVLGFDATHSTTEALLIRSTDMKWLRLAQDSTSRIVAMSIGNGDKLGISGPSAAVSPNLACVAVTTADRPNFLSIYGLDGYEDFAVDLLADMPALLSTVSFDCSWWDLVALLRCVPAELLQQTTSQLVSYVGQPPFSTSRHICCRLLALLQALDVELIQYCSETMCLWHLFDVFSVAMAQAEVDLFELAHNWPNNDEVKAAAKAKLQASALLKSSEFRVGMLPMAMWALEQVAALLQTLDLDTFRDRAKLLAQSPGVVNIGEVLKLADAVSFVAVMLVHAATELYHQGSSKGAKQAADSWHTFFSDILGQAMELVAQVARNNGQHFDVPTLQTSIQAPPFRTLGALTAPPATVLERGFFFTGELCRYPAVGESRELGFGTALKRSDLKEDAGFAMCTRCNASRYFPKELLSESWWWQNALSDRCICGGSWWLKVKQS